MLKTSFLALVLGGLVGLLGLVGCATTTASAYGNFTQSAPAAFHQAMAIDAVKQLVAVYAPASVRLDLQHATADVFGSSLVDSLRARGYALLEFIPESAGPAKSVRSSGSVSATSVATDIAPGASKPLRYIVDQPDANLYRVTLLVGNQSLTRAYLAAHSGTLHPAGAWVRKE
jgi:hypothetical protein